MESRKITHARGKKRTKKSKNRKQLSNQPAHTSLSSTSFTHSSYSDPTPETNQTTLPTTLPTTQQPIYQRSARHKNKANNKRKWIKITIWILLTIIIICGIYAYNIYNQVKETVNTKMYEPVQSIIHRPDQKEKLINKEPLNILLMGVDEREYDRGRTDTLIVLTINPNTNSMLQISIPRDTYTEIIGHGTTDKINHSYAFGGTDMTVATVESFTGIELDYYVKINMEGLKELVNALGGITVNNELEWYDIENLYEMGYHYKKGEIELNGEQAMGYVQMRYYDPEGDFGRNARQRKVIEAIINKGASFGSIGKIDDMLDVLGKNIETNLKFKDMKNIFSHYRDTRQNSSSYQIEGKEIYMDDIYYLIVSEEERQKLKQMITEFMNPQS